MGIERRVFGICGIHGASLGTLMPKFNCEWAIIQPPPSWSPAAHQEWRPGQRSPHQVSNVDNRRVKQGWENIKWVVWLVSASTPVVAVEIVVCTSDPCLVIFLTRYCNQAPFWSTQQYGLKYGCMCAVHEWTIVDRVDGLLQSDAFDCHCTISVNIPPLVYFFFFFFWPWKTDLETCSPFISTSFRDPELPRNMSPLPLTGSSSWMTDEHKSKKSQLSCLRAPRHNSHSRAGFLKLDIIYTLDVIVPCHGGCPIYWRMVSYIPAFYPLVAGSNP